MKKSWIIFAFMMNSAVSPQGIPEFNMKRVEAGQFYHIGIDDEGKRTVYYRIVISKPYYLSATEVTMGQWKAVMGSFPYSDYRYGEESLSKLPAANVSFSEIQEFISRLNKSASGKPYRLPTHAEWELAARGPGQSGETQPLYYWGDDISQSSAYEWTFESAEGHQQEAGTLKPNPNGIFDLWGNVGEWVSDGRNDMAIYEQMQGNKGDGKCLNTMDPLYCYPENHTLTDPKGDKGARRFRIITESAHKRLNSHHAGAHFRAYPKDYKHISIGFRLARDAD